MFDSKVRCPNCRATTLIRSGDASGYGIGECFNCRHDRSGELPGSQETPLPEGITKVPGGRFKLPDGSVVKGYDAMLAAVGGAK